MSDTTYHLTDYPSVSNEKKSQFAIHSIKTFLILKKANLDEHLTREAWEKIEEEVSRLTSKDWDELTETYRRG